MARILIVDDDEMDRLMERSMLDGLGHTLLFASDGDTALSVYQKQEVDLVIGYLVYHELDITVVHKYAITWFYHPR